MLNKHKLKQTLHQFKSIDWAGVYRHLLRQGGLKLKIIGGMVLVVFFAVGLLSHFLTGLLERSLTEKAYEVGQMAVARIADASFNAIVERTYANRVNLLEMLKETKEAQMEGFLDISIYVYERNQEQPSFNYFAGFAEQHDALQDTHLISQILASQDRQVLRDSVAYHEDGHAAQAIRFVRPVIFSVGEQKHVVGAVVLHYDQEAILGPVRHAAQISSLITMAILALSIVLAWWFSLRLTRPILRVSQAAKDVAEGDLDTKLDINTNDEIEGLAEEFNKMVKGLREHQRMSKFVSGSAMTQIQDDSAQVTLGGRYRTQTLLFSDIRGFTALSEHRAPEEVVEIINHYLDLQAMIIREHGGDIDKFVGDEIMATFEGDGDLQRALEAGVAIQQAIAQENIVRAKAKQVTVNVGVGINRGEVIVGNMGSNDRMDFTSIGASVNLAARLCSEATPGEVLIQQSLFVESASNLSVNSERSIKVKGFSQPLTVVAIQKGDL
ncbi:adenylate/guanylate cyclase domain-containing protein [Thiomicrospira pelophila]|uniref:adenylate/guanylate cyclase domain-containing protein n=1 Tax=Thiomicrospira pelophila TaxID=934 RepID=UPI00068B3B38|nr:adenylate/guanylate cyclase domain-containing protein [Thiomicrospira pelophila]